MELCELVDEAHDLALVDRGLASDPLSLSECVFDIVGAWGGTVDLVNFVRKSQVLLILEDFSF